MTGAMATEYWGLIDDRLATLSETGKRLYFRRLIWERDKGLCGICGSAVDELAMHLDHVTPKSLGGADHWDNLRVAHPACNVARGNGLPYRVPPGARRKALRGKPLPSLRWTRDRKLMRQVDLSIAAGVNRTTIALIEARGKAADLETMRKLADALGVTPAELMRPPDAT